ncbi:hypothetical protein ANO11243_018510 [Dothideomycetidae sp. 11243]|nr:hypothetical protein ANO11243_018510 [fungal sp. No.11243]
MRKVVDATASTHQFFLTSCAGASHETTLLVDRSCDVADTAPNTSFLSWWLVEAKRLWAWLKGPKLCRLARPLRVLLQHRRVYPGRRLSLHSILAHPRLVVALSFRKLPGGEFARADSGRGVRHLGSCFGNHPVLVVARPARDLVCRHLDQTTVWAWDKVTRWQDLHIPDGQNAVVHIVSVDVAMNVLFADVMDVLMYCLVGHG